MIRHLTFKLKRTIYYLRMLMRRTTHYIRYEYITEFVIFISMRTMAHISHAVGQTHVRCFGNVIFAR
jgi:hypothetical protein